MPRLVHKVDKPLTPRSVHTYWYRCLEAAGIVSKGTRRGQAMHRGRHTAGQSLLDYSGNLKAVQRLLGHTDIRTTADTYVDWDEEQLAELMQSMFDDA